jgi:hypothetical protein
MGAMISEIAIFDPNEHEPLIDSPWNAAAAQTFVQRIVRETDAAFGGEQWWPLHPEDAYGREQGSYRGLYSGAAGTMWGLHRLSRTAGVPLTHEYASAIVECQAAYERDPWDTGGETVPGYFMGTCGMLTARFAITGDERVAADLDREIRRNIGNVTREVFWGSSGSVLGALLIREATGTARFDGVLRDVQAELLQSWETSGEYAGLWLQDMYGKQQRYVGAGHGAFGNLAPFLRASDLLAPGMKAVVRERVAFLLETYALHDGEKTNWISMAEPRIGNRMQWCHGAPGIVMALASYPAQEERVETLLRRAGEAIWKAGPLKKSPGFCHGTAGNAYALLRLYQRTGDAMWLERAQQFAMHAIDQVAIFRERFGMPAYSLWNGDIGVALLVDSVLRRDPAVLALDVL